MTGHGGIDTSESESSSQTSARSENLWRELLKSFWDDYEWFVVGGLAATAFVLGYFGFENQPTAPGEQRSILDNLYHSLQLFWLEYGSASEPSTLYLDIARFLAPAMLFYAGVRAIMAITREQVQLFWMRLTWKDRVVICGLGRKGLLLARLFKGRGCSVAVIEKDDENDAIKGCRERGIVVLIGNATDSAMLRRARVHKAKYLIAVCGQDGTNADVAVHAQEFFKEKRSRNGELTAFVHVVDLELCELLRERVTQPWGRDSFRLELFNVFESGARAWMSKKAPLPKPGDSRRPHLVVVGAGQLGKALVVKSAKKLLTFHPEAYPRITIVDREAERRRDWLHLRYPQLHHVCELVAIHTDVAWPEFEEGKFLLDSEGRCEVTAIYICLDDDARGVAAALALLKRVRDNKVTIMVRTAEDAGLADLVRGKDGTGDDFELLRAFPLLEQTCTPEALLGETFEESLARSIHKDYVRREKEKGQTAERNPSIVDWQQLPESLKESNRRQADHIDVKLRAVGCDRARVTERPSEPFVFSEKEEELLAKLEHQRWMAERRFDGWTHAPGQKNLERKTSPDLVPWEELSPPEKEKDLATARELPALLQRAGFRVYRLSEGDVS
jgi:hypothetical protein